MNLGDRVHLPAPHAPLRRPWRTEADPVGIGSVAIPGNDVPIAYDSGAIEHPRRELSRDGRRTQVDEQQVGVGPAVRERQAAPNQCTAPSCAALATI